MNTDSTAPIRGLPHLSCVELCAGAGGQALGLERGGFTHHRLVELDSDACATLRHNRPFWTVLKADARTIGPDSLAPEASRLDLFAAGVPCPPFSLAGRQLGALDERDLFPAALRLIAGLRPRAVLLENVKGLLQTKFSAYRESISAELAGLGYRAEWKLLRACDFGVPQLRPRAVLVGLEDPAFRHFQWPEPPPDSPAPPTVGETLHHSMASRGWRLADHWARQASRIAPTLCGGSKKHGGPDLGPSRARKAWADMGVNGSSIATAPPGPGDQLPVKLTAGQMALLQGFPSDWAFTGGKTSVCRQIGNAFPPPVAEALGKQLRQALLHSQGLQLPSPHLREHHPHTSTA
ncbi:DNA cytosine methyltransferase [Streptomyces tsukubensis]|uniref:DNA cytosine methyltransferase n=1 Tax=Streptomyces tsukubensis TaxID=83656 RepID=UPI00344E62E1